MALADSLTVWIVNDGLRDHFYVTRADIPVEAVAAHFLAIDNHDEIGRIDPVGENDWHLTTRANARIPLGMRREIIHIEREPLSLNYWY
jgi:hypothetical protein